MSCPWLFLWPKSLCSCLLSRVMSLLLAQDAQRQEVLLRAGTRAVQGSKRIFGGVLSVLPDAPKLRLRDCEVKKDALRLQPN